MAEWLISAVAKQTGVSPPTIRYYEEIGLLPATTRSSAGYRRYSDAAVEELRFIKKAQALGFSLEEIGEILQLSRSGRTACTHVLSLAEHHVALVEQRIRQLQQFRDRLDAEISKWRQQEASITCEGLCRFITGT
jgi:DNA-binding transcriptional MerR regulator